MKTSTYLSLLIGCIIGGVISYIMFEGEVAITVGGAVGMTILYLRSKFN